MQSICPVQYGYKIAINSWANQVTVDIHLYIPMVMDTLTASFAVIYTVILQYNQKFPAFWIDSHRQWLGNNTCITIHTTLKSSLKYKHIIHVDTVHVLQDNSR